MSFLTYLASKEQEPFFFILLPLIRTLADTSFTTGSYGETLGRAFGTVVEGLPPGEHTISMRMYYCCNVM